MPRYESVYAPINTKTARKIALNSFIRNIKPWTVEALPFPASGNPTAKICPLGKLTNDGIWKFSENLCRGDAALRVRLRPTNTKTARRIALNLFSIPPKQGAVEALPFPAGGNPTAIISPSGKLTNDGI